MKDRIKISQSVIARNEAISELCRSGRWVFVSLCLFLSISALARTRDTAKVAAKLVGHKAPVAWHRNKVLVVLDGKIFKGYLASINPKDVRDVYILKPTSAMPIYGKQAAAGAIVITTKLYVRSIGLKKIKSVESAVGDSAVYVIDGRISNTKLNGIDPENILSIDVINKEKAEQMFPEGQAKNGMIVVITKFAAIKSYQAKLRAFSKKYEDYLDNHNGDDTKLIYIIDGVEVRGMLEEIIDKLFKLPAKSIKEVNLIDVKSQQNIITQHVIITTIK